MYVRILCLSGSVFPKTAKGGVGFQGNNEILFRALTKALRIQSFEFRAFKSYLKPGLRAVGVPLGQRDFRLDLEVYPAFGCRVRGSDKRTSDLSVKLEAFGCLRFRRFPDPKVR